MEWHPVAESTEERQVQTSNLWFIVTSQYVMHLILIQFYTGCLIHNWSCVWSHGQGKYLSAAKLNLEETWNALPQSHLRKLQTNVLQWIASKGPHKTLARFKTWFISFIWCFYISVMFKQLYTHFLGGIYIYIYCICWGKCCSPHWPYVFMCSSLCWSLIQITRWLRLFEKPNRRRMALQRWRSKQRKSISRRQ